MAEAKAERRTELEARFVATLEARFVATVEGLFAGLGDASPEWRRRIASEALRATPSDRVSPTDAHAAWNTPEFRRLRRELAAFALRLNREGGAS